MKEGFLLVTRDLASEKGVLVESKPKTSSDVASQVALGSGISRPIANACKGLHKRVFFEERFETSLGVNVAETLVAIFVSGGRCRIMEKIDVRVLMG